MLSRPTRLRPVIAVAVVVVLALGTASVSATDSAEARASRHVADIRDDIPRLLSEPKRSWWRSSSASNVQTIVNDWDVPTLVQYYLPAASDDLIRGLLSSGSESALPRQDFHDIRDLLRSGIQARVRFATLLLALFRAEGRELVQFLQVSETDPIDLIPLYQLMIQRMKGKDRRRLLELLFDLYVAAEDDADRFPPATSIGIFWRMLLERSPSSVVRELSRRFSEQPNASPYIWAQIFQYRILGIARPRSKPDSDERCLEKIRSLLSKTCPNPDAFVAEAVIRTVVGSAADPLDCVYVVGKSVGIAIDPDVFEGRRPQPFDGLFARWASTGRISTRQIVAHMTDFPDYVLACNSLITGCYCGSERMAKCAAILHGFVQKRGFRFSSLIRSALNPIDCFRIVKSLAARYVLGGEFAPDRNSEGSEEENAVGWNVSVASDAEFAEGRDLSDADIVVDGRLAGNADPVNGEIADETNVLEVSESEGTAGWNVSVASDVEDRDISVVDERHVSNADAAVSNIDELDVEDIEILLKLEAAGVDDPDFQDFQRTKQGLLQLLALAADPFYYDDHVRRNLFDIAFEAVPEYCLYYPNTAFRFAEVAGWPFLRDTESHRRAVKAIWRSCRTTNITEHLTNFARCLSASPIWEFDIPSQDRKLALLFGAAFRMSPEKLQKEIQEDYPHFITSITEKFGHKVSHQDLQTSKASGVCAVCRDELVPEQAETLEDVTAYLDEPQKAIFSLGCQHFIHLYCALDMIPSQIRGCPECRHDLAAILP